MYLPNNPWDAFTQEFAEKLEQSRRRQLPLWQRVKEDCPAVLCYFSICAVFTVIGVFPWMVGAKECGRWLASLM